MGGVSVPVAGVTPVFGSVVLGFIPPVLSGLVMTGGVGATVFDGKVASATRSPATPRSASRTSTTLL